MTGLETKLNQILNEKITKIIPANIKKDVQIFDITGTLEEGVDTSDANAVANDIVTGKTAYVNAQKITGTYTGIVPTGTLSVSQNGTVDVTNYASASVNVSSGGPITQEEYEIDLELARSILQDTVLPYYELEYIQSTGTQYINTHFYPTQNTKIVLKMKTEGLIEGANTFNIFGTASTNSRFGWWAIYLGGNSYFRYGIEGNGRDSKISLDKTYVNDDFTVTLDKNYAIIQTPSQTYTYAIPPTNDFILDLPLILGGHIWNNGSSIGQCECNYKLYYCKLYENNVLVRDYIPAKDKLTNEVGLYDKIGEKLYTSSSQDEYIAGGVV